MTAGDVRTVAVRLGVEHEHGLARMSAVAQVRRGGGHTWWITAAPATLRAWLLDEFKVPPAEVAEILGAAT